MNIKFAACLYFSFLIFVAGCGGGKQVQPEAMEPSMVSEDSLDVSQLIGRRPATLAELVSISASQQYSSLDSIYNRPPEGMSGNYYVQLTERNEVVNLAQGVTSFIQKGDVLAAGFKNGVIKIYGGAGCGAVQTSSEPVNTISWFPGANHLASSSGENRVVEVFRVDQCARIRVADVNSTVDLFSLSPKGTWLALVDEARRLWVGPADGKLRRIHRFLHKPLSLSFSDGEGILMGVDVTGQLNMWSPLKLTRIFEHKIKGGPFEKVETQGPYLNIVTEKGDKFTYDVGKRSRTSYRQQSRGFSLHDTVLSYRSPRKRLVKKVFFKPVVMDVQRSSSGDVLRVNDIDGEFRYYSATTGELLEGVQDFADWKMVKLNRDFRFSHRGEEFVLAEPIAQREFQRLYCRFIPGKGYFLWWEKVARPDDYFKSRGMVPRREGLSAASPVTWESLESGKIDIRD